VHDQAPQHDDGQGIGHVPAQPASRRHDGDRTRGQCAVADHVSSAFSKAGDMPEGTLRAILKQAGIDAETFLQKN